MKRTAVFAHYDKNNLIQDYVVYYLSELKKCAEKIIFVSDSDVLPVELKKIEDIVEHSIIGRHGEYDFGSYKRGFLYAKENNLLTTCEELILANDSCYAPLFPFKEMFSVMSQKTIDFWGATSSDSGIKKEDEDIYCRFNHIQSYFIVFKPAVFNSDIFNNFITSVKKENTKEEIVIKYEMGMTHLLEENGFKCDSYCELSKKVPSAHITAYINLIRHDKSPFLKREITLYRNAEVFYPILVKYLIKRYTKYDYNLIQNDVKKNARYLTLLEHIKYCFKTCRRFVYRRRRKERLICFLGNWYSY